MASGGNRTADPWIFSPLLWHPASANRP